MLPLIFSLIVLSPCQAKEIQIHMKGMGFSPPQVSASTGDTVEWINDDFVLHSATAKNGEWNLAVPPNGKKELTLKDAGTFDYFCRFHPTMKGKITVGK